MKNCGKKLLALALAAAMSGCMVSAFANTVSFESVQVIKSDGETVKATYTAEQIASGSVKIARVSIWWLALNFPRRKCVFNSG